MTVKTSFAALLVLVLSLSAARTYAGGYARLLRAEGDKNVDDSIAANNYAAARSAEIDNQLKAEQTYSQMRDLNKEWMTTNEGRPLTAEETEQIAQARAPKRTDESQLDPASGKINWPIILRDAPYQADLDQIDSLFADRATGGTLNGGQYAEVQKLHDDLVATLTANAKNYKDYDLIAAKNLIDSLAYEARFATT
ncbi:MAG TPA: hypothetical protein VKB78_02195 [Pirellulales bacterium]|nr:hypothetical protein [Pirellulales bacterium]